MYQCQLVMLVVLILDCRRILLVGIQDVKNYEFRLEETEEEFKQQQQNYEGCSVVYDTICGSIPREHAIRATNNGTKIDYTIL